MYLEYRSKGATVSCSFTPVINKLTVKVNDILSCENRVTRFSEKFKYPSATIGSDNRDSTVKL